MKIVATEERIFLSKRASIVYQDQKGVKYVRKQGEFVRLDKLSQKGAGGRRTTVVPDLSRDPTNSEAVTSYRTKMYEPFINKSDIITYLTKELKQDNIVDKYIKDHLEILINSIPDHKFPIKIEYDADNIKFIIKSKKGTTGIDKLFHKSQPFLSFLFLKRSKKIVPVNSEQVEFKKIFIGAYIKSRNIIELLDNLRAAVIPKITIHENPISNRSSPLTEGGKMRVKKAGAAPAQSKAPSSKRKQSKSN